MSQKAEQLRRALNAFEPEGYSPVDTQQAIAAAIVSELGITREWFDSEGYLWKEHEDDATDALQTILALAEGER